MKTPKIVILLLIIPFVTVAQSSDSLQKKAMEKLNWIVGSWEGITITQMGPGQSDTIIMNENIKYSLDSTVIVIEGKGFMRNVNGKKGKLAHDAMAIISYNNYTQKYRWNSWRVPGAYYQEFEPIIRENGLSWGMQTPQGYMRYNLILDENGEWEETGEFSKDNENWFPFLSMHLIRKN